MSFKKSTPIVHFTFTEKNEISPHNFFTLIFQKMRAHTYHLFHIQTINTQQNYACTCINIYTKKIQARLYYLLFSIYTVYYVNILYYLVIRSEEDKEKDQDSIFIKRKLTNELFIIMYILYNIYI